MITPRTALAVGKMYHAAFTSEFPVGVGHTFAEELFEFLLERNYPAWFCDRARGCYQPRDVRDIFISLERGNRPSEPSSHEAVARNQAIGQDILKRVASDILNAKPSEFPSAGWHSDERKRLVACLELDGYTFRDGQILRSEGEEQEIEAERGELETTYAALGLGNPVTVKEHLRLCEDHFSNGRFTDSVHNARQYLEQVLMDVALAWSKRAGSQALPKPVQDMRAVHYREYLKAQGLLTPEEHDAFAKLYGLLSVAGGHPGLSEQKQARVFRRLAISMALYAVLAFEAKTTP